MSEMTRERTGALQVGIDDDGEVLIIHPALRDEAMSLSPQIAYDLGIALIKVSLIAMGDKGDGLQA